MGWKGTLKMIQFQPCHPHTWHKSQDVPWDPRIPCWSPGGSQTELIHVKCSCWGSSGCNYLIPKVSAPRRQAVTGSFGKSVCGTGKVPEEPRDVVWCLQHPLPTMGQRARLPPLPFLFIATIPWFLPGLRVLQGTNLCGHLEALLTQLRAWR